MTVEKAGICSPCQGGRVTAPPHCQLRIVLSCRFLGATKRTGKLVCDLALERRRRSHISGNRVFRCVLLSHHLEAAPCVAPIARIARIRGWGSAIADSPPVLQRTLGPRQEGPGCGV